MPISIITTYAMRIPPIAIMITIVLIYAFFAGGRWSWPMTIDAGLLGLYAWKSNYGMLTFVLVLIGIRHTPKLALAFVVLCKWHEFRGWTLRALIFILPGLQRYASNAPQAAPEKARGDDLPPMIAAQSAPAPEPQLPLLLGEGLKLLNSDPTAPHVGVIGATRLGKTTFVGVMLAYRESELVIATPKSELDDPWFGAVVARPATSMADQDYSPIEQAISYVYKEMLRRNMPGVRDRAAITLVLDEWPELAEIPGVVKKVVHMIRRGAASGIRLILMATDVNVRSWRMDGMAGVLDNLVFAKVEAGRNWSIGRLDPNWRLIAPRALDTEQVQGIAARVSLAGRGWPGARVTAPASDPLLGGLLAQAVGAGPVGVSVGVRVPAGGVGGVPPDMALQTHTNKQTNGQTDRIALYRAWRGAGIKRDQARLIRQGMGEGLDDAEWAEAGRRLGM